MARRYGTYLYRRNNSQNWYLRLQSCVNEHRKVIEVSLGTTNNFEAELLAIERIKDHKISVLNKKIGGINHNILSQNADFTSKTENSSSEYQAYKVKDGTNSKNCPNNNTKNEHNILQVENTPQNRIRTVSNDQSRSLGSGNAYHVTDQIISRWVKQRGIVRYVEESARQSLSWLTETTGKPSHLLDRKDALLLIEELERRGLKSQTISTKVSFVRAAFNIAVMDGIINKNPFLNIYTKKNDQTDRLPLVDDDISKVEANFHRLSDTDRTLFQFLKFTGCRLAEPFQIQEEFSEAGLRYVIVGTKTKSSKRRLPIPQSLESLLPAQITKENPLMSGDPHLAGKRLNYFLRSIGITDERKVLHSLRHRAKDKLRAAGCSLDIQYQILGHEQKTVAAGYGVGYPMHVIQHWMKFLE